MKKIINFLTTCVLRRSGSFPSDYLTRIILHGGISLRLSHSYHVAEGDFDRHAS